MKAFVMMLALSLLVGGVMIMSGCSKNLDAVEQRIPRGEIIGYSSQAGYIERFFDNESGNVCYFTFRGISCVPMKAQPE